MVFHWSLRDSKSPQVPRTRFRILAFLSNAVVWIVSTRLPTSKSSRPFSIMPNAPITIGTIVTFMFHSFFNSLARSRYLSFFSLSFGFILWSARTAKSTILQILFFCWLLLLLLLFLESFSYQDLVIIIIIPREFLIPRSLWVFLLILIMLLSGWSLFLFWFQTPPSLSVLFQMHPLLIVLPSCSTVVLILWQDPIIFLHFHLGLLKRQYSQGGKFFFSC